MMEQNCKGCRHSVEGFHEMVRVRRCGRSGQVVEDRGHCEGWSARGTVIWLTGVPASGKTTIAVEVERLLRQTGLRVNNLDADDVRTHLNPNLGYTEKGRNTNTKNLAWMAQRSASRGVHAIVGAVSNLRIYRTRARLMAENAGARMLEIYVYAPLEVCQERDPKGLYARAATGVVKDIAGMHIPYEEPENADLVVDTTSVQPADAAASIIELME